MNHTVTKGYYQMSNIISQHFGYENMIDFDYIKSQKDLLNRIDQQIESGESTQFTLDLRRDLKREIEEAEAGKSPWKKEPLFSFLFMPPIR